MSALKELYDRAHSAAGTPLLVARPDFYGFGSKQPPNHELWLGGMLGWVGREDGRAARIQPIHSKRDSRGGQLAQSELRGRRRARSTRQGRRGGTAPRFKRG